MTEYHFINDTKTLLPSTEVQEKKAARKKLLALVFERRKHIYRRFLQKKRRLQTGGDVL